MRSTRKHLRWQGGVSEKNTGDRRHRHPIRVPAPPFDRTTKQGIAQRATQPLDGARHRSDPSRHQRQRVQPRLHLKQYSSFRVELKKRFDVHRSVFIAGTQPRTPSRITVGIPVRKPCGQVVEHTSTCRFLATGSEPDRHCSTTMGTPTH